MSFRSCQRSSVGLLTNSASLDASTSSRSTRGEIIYERLTSLGLGGYNQDDLVCAGSVLRAWLKSLRFPIDVPDYYGPNCDRTAGYHYVLVDTERSITQTGGLLSAPCLTSSSCSPRLNDQNVEGTRKFLTEVGILDAQPAPKPYMIVASLVPIGEIDKSESDCVRSRPALAYRL